MKNNYILAYFNDEEPLMEAVKAVRGGGTAIKEVYSPFPIHGIDDLLDYKRSRLPIAAFLFGCVGFSLGLAMQTYMLGVDWPMNVGGKPAMAWPDFVPVTFEATVLITALGMVGTFFAACGFYPGAEAKIPDTRVTDDLLVIAIEKSKISGSFEQLSQMLMSKGAIEIKEEEIEL